MGIELNNIYHSEAIAFMEQLPDNYVDLTISSPPYGEIREYKGFTFDFEGIAQQLFRITKQGGVLVWVVADQTVDGSESGDSFRQALYFKDTCGFNLHDTMIFLKEGFQFPESTRYQPVFEYMFIFSKGKPKTFNPIKRKTVYGAITQLERERQQDGTISKKHMRYSLESGNVGNVWLYGTGYMKSGKDKIAFQHPAIFPEQLAADHIISWSNKGDLIFDPMMGSGTVAKMSIILNRNFIGCDISEEYVALAKERINPYQQQLRLSI